MLKYQIVLTNKQKTSDNITPGIPIAIFYDVNVSTETREMVDKAILSINNGIKYGRNKWAFQIQTVAVRMNSLFFRLLLFTCTKINHLD